MPYELRQSIRLTLRMDELDVGEIAGADVAIKLMIADMKTSAEVHGFAVEVDKAKLVGVRGKNDGGQYTPELTLPDHITGVTGQAAGEALPQNATVAGDLTDAEQKELEIPEHLRRGKKT